jgi:HUS1 checkpoint protein
MRFKAKLAPEQVSLLHSIIVPMTRMNGGTGSNDTMSLSRSSNNNSHHKTRSSSSSSQHNHYTSSSFSRNGTILYFDTDHVRISCKGNNNNNTSIDAGITCFVELNAQGYTSIFLDRRIESVAPNNAIVMEIDIQQLRIALKSVLGNNTNDHNAASTTWNDAQRYVVIKLAKRQNIPCLCIDACSIASTTSSKSNNTGNTCTIQVHHAIPVRILRHTEMTHHLPPPIKQLPTLQLEIVPSPYNLRNVLDRLKHISSTIYLEANSKGELTISAHTDGASIQTYFSKFIPRFDVDDNDDGDDGSPTQQRNASNRNVTTRIKMDTKKLAASLQWQHQPTSSSSSSSSNSIHQMVSSALLCLIENEMVVVHVNLYPMNVGFLTYYVPVHYLSDDPYED